MTRTVSLLCIAASIMTSACTPTRSRIDPPFELQGKAYATMQALQAQASAVCSATGAPDVSDRPSQFVTDGCSMWPDGGWRTCCIEHDIEYWCGGSTLTRAEADRQLRECVAGLSGATNAFLMYLGVRVGGHPLWPFGWRWGYGYPWWQVNFKWRGD